MAPVVLIAPDTSRLNVERAVRRVSAERRALVERLLRVQDRQAALAAWLLLERALEWRYGIAEMGPWAREPGGKPFLARHPLIHFNLSHTAGVAVCAVDDRPVGIDVERVGPAQAHRPGPHLPPARRAHRGTRCHPAHVLPR